MCICMHCAVLTESYVCCDEGSGPFAVGRFECTSHFNPGYKLNDVVGCSSLCTDKCISIYFACSVLIRLQLVVYKKQVQSDGLCMH